MNAREWPRVPVGLDAQHWLTRSGCRRVLVVAHTVVSCQRLLDVAAYIEDDPRLQLVFTVAPDLFNRPVTRYLERLGASVLPWELATRETFDLALAASYTALHEVHAPLVVLAHGAGHGKPVRPPERGGPVLTQPPVYGLDAQRLTHNGRVIASAVVLATEGELDVLRRQCPEAEDVAVIAGDPCYDRLLASEPHRREYRRVLGVDERQELVVLASTWGHDGLFGYWPDLFPLLVQQLPAKRFRVGALLHPAIWEAHGHRQVRAWLRDCQEAGLLLLDPTDDWRGMIVAADHVVGDHGSVTAYAAAIGRRVMLLSGLDVASTSGSPQALVAASAPRLDPRQSIGAQLGTPAALDRQAVTAALTSRPGDASIVLRRVMYRLLNLSQPGRHRRTEPAPVPRTLSVKIQP